jgi:hypothetical protein
MIQLSDSDVQSLLDDAKRERDSARAAIDAKYEKELAAIRLVQKMLERKAIQQTGAAETEHAIEAESSHRPRMVVTRIPVPADLPASTENGDWHGLRRAIRKAVSPHGDVQFRLDEVMEWLAETFPSREFDRSAVSGELYQLRKRGEIKIITKGAGKLSHTYAKGETLRFEL